jgi:hypothetical protein
MDHILALGPAELALAVRRFRAYGNSPAAMARHFRERGERACERLARRLHALECELGVDLGALCARYLAREDPQVCELERDVLENLAEWGRPLASGPVLLVHVDRVQALNALVEGRILDLRAALLESVRPTEGRADPV